MMSSSGSPTSPSAPNLLQTTYNNFQNSTPLVTRLIISCAFVTYISSIFFIDITPLVSSNVTSSLFSFQFHRLFLSPFVCTSLLSLIFTGLRFMESGKRIEHHIGSTNFATLLLAFGTLTNLLHIVSCLMLYSAMGSTLESAASETETGTLSNVTATAAAAATIHEENGGGGDVGGEASESAAHVFNILSDSLSVGVWNLVLAMTAAEYSTADPSSQTRFFLFSIPTRYYPLLLLFINGISISHCIALALGYAFGTGKYLEFIKLKVEMRRRLEGYSWFQRLFTSMDGFVPGPISSSNSLSGNVTETWSITYPTSNSSHEIGSSSSSSMGGGPGGFFNNAMMMQNPNLQQPSSGIGGDNSSGYTPTLFKKPANAQSSNDTSRNRNGKASGWQSQGQGNRLGAATLRSNANTGNNNMNTNTNTNNNTTSNRVDRSMLLAAAERRAAGIAASTHDEEKGVK